MGNSQYRRQHYIIYYGYKYSLPSVAGFVRQSGDYYLFPPPETSGGQGSERVKCLLTMELAVEMAVSRFHVSTTMPHCSLIKYKCLNVIWDMF